MFFRKAEESWPFGLRLVFRAVLLRCSGIFLLVISALISTGLSSRPVVACPVCVSLPDASLADHLISADIIILAAPAPDNPFKFAPKDLIKGAPEDLARLPEIPFLVDSTTRAMFRNDPKQSILFTYGAIDKDAAGRSTSRSWKRIFTLTPEREQFLAEIRKAAKHWPLGSLDSPERIEFFAKYVTASDPVLRDTALVEFDRAPYPAVRALRPEVSTDQLMKEFRNINRINFIPVSIRLLGLQTDDSDAAEVVRSRYPRVLRVGGGYPYEWALAGLEVDGLTAVKALDIALQVADRKLEDRQSLIRALADAGTVSPNLRGPIVDIFLRSLSDDSALALNIALAARDWQETRLDHQLKSILENEDTDPVTRFVIQTKLGSIDQK